MGHARSQLSQRAQLVGARGSFSLLLLFGYVVRNSEDARSLSVDNDWRAVNLRIAHTAVARDIARFVRLRLARQRCRKVYAPHLIIVFVRTFDEVMADDFVKLVTSHLEHCLVAPLVMPVRVDRVDRFARTLQNVL